MTIPAPSKTIVDWLLLLARIISGGALLLAGAVKLGLLGGVAQLPTAPLLFALSLQSFKLVPHSLVPVVSYFVPWCEVVAGGMLVLGVWSRQSAAIVTAMLLAFTLALASVLLRDMNVDCGCFGGLFGEAKVTWGSIARNFVLSAFGAVVLVRGGGAIALKPDAIRP